MSAYRFTVAICTRNRPEDLALALDSLAGSQVPIAQIVVSDDSSDDRTRRLVAERFPHVDYVEGPRRGLCANRNRAASAATGTHLLYIDDDVTLGATFFEEIVAALDAVPAAERAKRILSGRESLRERLVVPGKASFLGFQERRYADGEPLETVVINAAVFPVPLFEEIGFDENLVYGYDEIDFTTRAVARGYRITLVPDAVNVHHSSDVNRDHYRTFMNASRLFVTYKRYRFTDRAPLRALAYALVAGAHLCIGAIRGAGPSGVALSVASLRSARAYLRAYRDRRTDAAPRTPLAHPAH